jgi:serine/threonine-protein kinase
VAQLLEAETESPLWSETYDRHLDDIFAIQSDVAIRIASALEAELSSDLEQRMRKRPTDNLAAYRLYLEGRHCVFRFTSEGIRRGLSLHGRAIQLDPEYALAHVGTGYGYVLIGLGYAAGVLTPRQASAKAKQAVITALELDPELGEAHSMLGLIHFAFEYDWEGAKREIRRALELNPGSSEIHGVWGLLLAALERYDEAIAARQQAQELDPLAAVHSSDLATSYIRAGRYDEAISEARRLIELEPEFPMAHSTLGWTYLKTGRSEDGLVELGRAVETAPGNTMLLAQLGQAYAEVGQRGEALAILDRLGKMAEEQYVSPYHLAYVHTGLREFDRAVECLEQAFDQRAGGLYGVKGSFLFTPLHSHSGFQALLQRMRLV